jgi:hypothetical protein
MWIVEKYNCGIAAPMLGFFILKYLSLSFGGASFEK